MSDRLSCCVPFCTHTRGDRKNDPLRPGMEWLCEEHWKSVPTRLKRRRSKLRRIRRKDPHNDFIYYRSRVLDIRVWEQCKRYAIERAAGI